MKIKILIALFMMLRAVSTGAADHLSDAPIYVVAYVGAAANTARQATGILERYRDMARGERGAASIDLYAQKGRDGQFISLEVWQSAAAFQAHMNGASVAQLTRDLGPVELGPWDVRPHTAYLLGEPVPAREQAVILVTHVDVPPPATPDYEKLIKTYIEGSRKEPGADRLDVFQALSPRTNHFTVLEVWSEEAARNVHQRGASALSFRTELAPRLGALYDEREYRMVK